MASDKHLLTPTAVLLAGAMIAAGLFFGLRGRDSTPPPASSGSSVDSASPAPGPVGAPVTAQPARETAPAAPAATVDRSAVTAAAAKDLDRHRAAIVDKCVKPALAQRPEPSRVNYVFNVTFDAQGKQIARGMLEERQGGRPEITQCMNDALPSLEIPPPGNSVQVDLPWTLP